MKITIESLKKLKCKEVLHSLCPTDLHVPEKIILWCFLPLSVVRRVQKWAGKYVVQRVPGGLHFRHIFVAQEYSSII